MTPLFNKFGLGLLLVAALFSLHFSCAAMKIRGEKCWRGQDCDTKVCSRRKVCECYPVHDYTTGSKVEQEYNRGICQSKVMTMCTLPMTKDDGLPVWNCIANATCKFAQFGRGSRELFGVCECNPGYLAVENNSICAENFKAVTSTETTGSLNTEESPHASATRSLLVELSTQSPTGPTTDFHGMKIDKIDTYSEKTNLNSTTKSIETQKIFGENCIEHTDCYSKFCNSTTQNCDCNLLFDYGKEKMVLQYKSNGKCLSRVNQTCFMPSSNNAEESICVNGAACSLNVFNETMIQLGYCVCKSGYTSNSNGTECFPNATATSSASLKERIKAFTYMLSLVFNSFVRFVTTNKE